MGPFGSAFSLCFASKTSKASRSSEIPRFDAVVIVGGGIGLPSALSALREFIRRRKSGKAVPSHVFFVWQCRHPEEVTLCWESLHRAIFYDGLQQSGEGDLPLPLDGWDASSAMLGWLGVAVYVSRPSAAMETLKARNPLGNDSDTALKSRVHEWFAHPRRLREGYFEVDKILVWLSQRARQRTDCAVALSFCGGPTTFKSLKAQVARAKKHPLMRGGSVELEFAADHQ